MNEQSHVALSEVVRRYDGPPVVHALGPIDLVIRRGEFFSIVGPSGCGKSTLLDLVCGLVRPTSGSAKFEGQELHGEVPDGVGVMSARPGRFIDMVETGWSRDRDSRVVADPKFGTLTSRLWTSLREESLKTMGRAA